MAFSKCKSHKSDTRASSVLSVVNLNISSLREVCYFRKRQRQTTCFFIGFKLKPALFFLFKELFVQILWSLNVWFETSLEILPPLQILPNLRGIHNPWWRQKIVHWISGSLPPRAVMAFWYFSEMPGNVHDSNTATNDTGAMCVHIPDW